MSQIDQIIAILGPPQSQGEKDRLAGLAEKTNKTLEEIYVERVPGIVENLDSRDGSGPSNLDRLFSEILGYRVSVRNPTPTYFEKKGACYPAITFSSADIVDENSAIQAELLTEVFRTEAAKSSLARKLGIHLSLEAVEVFVTYGS
ncbi:MAG: hypothetical protein OER85_00320 [Gammaproteobacteria bacterium]|nr:hypothetical protein [Gammaproteobacteria bacterium]